MSSAPEPTPEAIREGLRSYLAAFLPPDEAARSAAELLRAHPFAAPPELLSIATTELLRTHGAPRAVVIEVLTEDLGLTPRIARVLVTQPWSAGTELRDAVPDGLFTEHPRSAAPGGAPAGRSRTGTAAADAAGATVPRGRTTGRSWVSARVLVALALLLLVAAALALRPQRDDRLGVDPDGVTVLEHALSPTAAAGGGRPDQDTTTFGAGPVLLWLRVDVSDATTLRFRWNTPDGRTLTSDARVAAGTMALTATLPSADKTVGGTYGVQVSAGEQIVLTRTFEVLD